MMAQRTKAKGAGEVTMETGGLAIGQRWISEAEPELGLGKIVEIDTRSVQVAFPASDTVRRYAIDNAPLRRVRFRPGDRVSAGSGRSIRVTEVVESGGLLCYRGEGKEITENELSERTGFSTPRERLLGGRVDPNPLFDLRYRTLVMRHQSRSATVRGFLGGRVDLIPHQFYIAREVAGRQAPRVLLSDETGLGKTIETGLVLHRLVISGRVGRVLILLPESLVHQWFVELLRRFNLIFKIYDEPACRDLEKSRPGDNPFLEDQFILSSIDVAAGSLHRADQVASAPWDLVIVDEAHHLKITSPGYALVEALAGRVSGLILLTATPEQLGQASHFARLRLLDPHRYRDLETFDRETRDYQQIADLASAVMDGQPLSGNQQRQLSQHLWGDDTPKKAVKINALLDRTKNRQRIIEDLIDRHGIGRVVFRNTRRRIQGFPPRRIHLVPLDPDPGAPRHLSDLAAAFDAENGGPPAPAPPDYDADPRVAWLADFLRAHNRDKVLLICRSVEKARNLNAALEKRIFVRSALFHEALSLIHRDRNAAWFADPRGARILICSEIGSEGRNFQFARHLVLFDLPLDPEQLEQRIGRLDRIGRTTPVEIHVPYLRGSVHEVLARWFHHGLNAFGQVLAGGRQILDRFGPAAGALALNFHRRAETREAVLNRLVEKSAAFKETLGRRLEKGQDRLLDMCAFRPDRAATVIDQVEKMDRDPALERFMTDVFETFGIDVEPLAPRTSRLRPARHFDASFPGFRGEEMVVTFDRATALVREDITFLTRDHPMVTEAMELLLGSDRGNAAVARWSAPGAPALLLEAVFVLECVAPPGLHLDRFLPPTPIRVVVDHQGNDTPPPVDPVFKDLSDKEKNRLLETPGLVQEVLPQMLAASRLLAGKQRDRFLLESARQVGERLDREIDRLRALSRVNPGIREEEIQLAGEQKAGLEKEIQRARLRLDALRLIRKGP
jgi:ATP-dependent helicase HepA